MLDSWQRVRICGNQSFAMTTFQRVLIWDLPVRLLHLVLAGSVSVALVLALGFGEDHPLFVYHACFGMLAAGALLVRVMLGVVGSRYARFSSWSLSPRTLVASIKATLTGKPAPREAGHNPAASWVMMGMLVLVAAVVGTGLSGGEDLHEIIAYALLGFIGLHLAGLLIHTIWHNEPIALSMVDGKKVAPGGVALSHASPVMGVFVALLLAGWAIVLARGFDSAAGALRLPFLSRSITLVENENGDHREHAEDNGHDDD
jgi:cytochrome b